MAGCYVHIPFCKSRCRYCDFFSTTKLSRSNDYINAVMQELSLRKTIFSDILRERDERLTTVYFGGGTPSALCEDDIVRTLNAILGALDAQNTIQEVTVEVNPSDVTPTLLGAYRDAGVNRLSIGVQTFDDDRLRMIGRRHDRSMAIRAIEEARRAGFDNISIDLMYGLPNENLSDWNSDIDEAIAIGAEHISAYCLTYEEGTPLYMSMIRGEVSELDDDILNQMHDTVVDRLSAAGIYQYEISNFARPGFYSRHNSSYWTGSPYLGLGAGAYSYDGQHVRQNNITDLDIYIKSTNKAYQAGSAQYLPIEREVLGSYECYNEAVMLGLRMCAGVNINKIADNYQNRFIKIAEGYVAKGLLAKDGDYYKATRSGQHILNIIIEDLMI